jgi:formylglycine-generating enzyme required for sulfatase activity
VRNLSIAQAGIEAGNIIQRILYGCIIASHNHTIPMRPMKKHFRNDVVQDTTEVGTYESGRSPYGAYDMAGNVWEWVADWYSDTYYLNTPLTDPAGPITGEYHVLRGGSWHDGEDIVRAANRGWNQLEYFYNTDSQ